MWGNILKIEKAQWSAAFINSLPDAAFAYIEAGGEKDEEGKTTPRALRHLPHHDSSVKFGSEKESVDLPHLRNAMARLEQTNISDEAKREAKNHLEMHEKQWDIGEAGADGDVEMGCGGKDEKIKKSLWGDLI